MNIGSAATLAERFRYAPHDLPPQDMHDALTELEAWREVADGATPQELEEKLDELEGKQCKGHEDYDELKSFFEDCVQSLNGHWPAAEAYDQNLRRVICNAITRGDEPESLS